MESQKGDLCEEIAGKELSAINEDFWDPFISQVSCGAFINCPDACLGGAYSCDEIEAWRADPNRIGYEKLKDVCKANMVRICDYFVCMMDENCDDAKQAAIRKEFREVEMKEVCGIQNCAK